MRRAPQTTPLSPFVIRQIVLITLIVTALLAMFASGENNQLVQAMKDRQAQNRLVQAEAAKLGVRRVENMYKAPPPPESGEGFEKLNGSGNSGPGPSASGSSSEGPGRTINPSAYGPNGFADETPTAPDGKPVKMRRAKNQPAKKKIDVDIDAIRAASKLRSGAASGVEGG